MNNTLRQILVVVTILATITVNILANALPLNGLNTGEISDRFQVYFVPAGYVFSIWGLIYLGLLAYAIFQALPSQKDNPRLQAIGGWVILGGLANIAWIFLWHYEQFVGTLGAMLILLATLIAVYVRLGTGLTRVPPAETWAVRVPFSIYLGWISVATVANVSDVLDYVGWNRWGWSDEGWMILILAVVVGLAALVNLSRRDVAYTAVLLWALAGIGVKFPQQGIVTAAIWVAFVLVALTLPAAYLLRRKS
jgi:hypothetical protein